jgi:tetratricopeptide (TPR) repeat protein
MCEVGSALSALIQRGYWLILMTQPDATSSVPEENAARPGAAVEAAVKPVDGELEPETEAPPIPWTPERVLEWNAYYDIYVMLAALLLVFVVSAVRIDENNPMIWSHLKTGELIGQRMAPVTSDPFSYSAPGERWVNVPWLFQWGHAAVYNFVRGLVPVDQNDPTANQESAERIAIGVLIGLNAFARLLTAWILLRIRRKGPGLWWSAICVSIALGAILGPFGILPGGIAGPGIVTPGTWGMLLLAIELLLLHRAYNEGSARALYGLVPVFLLWANVDDSFLMGLLILGAAAIGRVLDGQAAASLIQPASVEAEGESSQANAAGKGLRPVAGGTGLVVLAICVAACLVNPSTYHVFAASLAPVQRLLGSDTELYKLAETSFFGKQLQRQLPQSWYLLTVYYLIVVALGLTAFLVNSRRFAWSRFLPFALAAAVWGIFRGYGQEFALVFASVMALNGQEWYQDRFGTRGRMGTRWTIWSTGGRLVTLATLFFAVSVAITGWRQLPEQPRFGFAFDANDFPFEAADYLSRHEDIKGNVLNSTAAEGDALIWKAYPARRTFIDSRAHVFPQTLLEEHRKLRNAIRDDNQPDWKPGLDKYGISVVMIDSGSSPRTYERLMQSPNWIPFYDDGRVVMFGRADAAEPDLTAFKNNRLEPELRAFRVSQPVPSVDRPPTPTTWIDEIFRNRLASRPQSHTNSAVRWLQGSVPSEGDQPEVPDPARCLLAIREARTALAKNPDDWVAYRLLDAAYRLLTQHETALLAGMPLNKDNLARISMLVPNIEILSTRFQQRVTALNYAIQTTPPATSPEARRELRSLHLELHQLFLQAGFLDLARDHLQAAIDLTPSEDAPTEAMSRYRDQLEQLNQRVQQIGDNLTDLQVERQAGPVDKAMLARSQGAPGLAIAELEEAERGSMSPMIVRPQLVDLYCATGQPDRALELLSMGASDDPNLGSEPGMSFKRQGQVYLLLGNYLSAASLWQERAIPRLRFDRTMRALQVAQVFGRGELVPAINTDESIPTLLTRQAFWSFDLAQALLESGEPDRAAEYFTQALKLVPDLPVRPIIAYYLERMGRPVPELPKAAGPVSIKPKSAVAELLETPMPVTGAAAAVKPAPAPAPATETAKPKKP